MQQKVLIYPFDCINYKIKEMNVCGWKAINISTYINNGTIEVACLIEKKEEKENLNEQSDQSGMVSNRINNEKNDLHSNDKGD